MKMIGLKIDGGREARVQRRGAHDICALICDVPARHQEGPHYQSNLSDRADSLNCSQKIGIMED